MKKVDETALLLALGDVGDDLLERAERPRKRVPVSRHFGALAACFALLVVLAVPAVYDRASMNGMISDNTAPENAAQDSDSVAPGISKEESAQEGSGAVQLRHWGVFSAADLQSIQVDARGKNDAVLAEDAETKHGEDLAEPSLAVLYTMLADAALGEEETVLRNALSVSITLSSGVVLEGAYDAENQILKLERLVFQGVDLSPWL